MCHYIPERCNLNISRHRNLNFLLKLANGLGIWHSTVVEFQVYYLVTPLWILLCCTTYKILYMCRILVPVVRFGAYFKMYTPCCRSVWSTSRKRCLKANVARFCENVAWIPLDEFWMPSWVAQVLNGFQMCIKNHISQWTLGYSVCCGEGWVWKDDKLIVQICFLPYILYYMYEVRKQVQDLDSVLVQKTLVQIRYRISK